MADFEPISGDEMDATSRWSASAGTTSFEFIHNLLNNLGISFEGPARPETSDLPGDLQFSIDRSHSMDFWAPYAAWDGFTSGELRHHERLSITWPGGRLDTNGFSIRPTSADTLEMIDDQGNTLFAFNYPHTMLYPNQQRMTLDNMDMRLTPWLATKMGFPDLGGFVIAAAHIHTDMEIPPGGQTEGSCSNPIWDDGDQIFTDVKLIEMETVQQVAHEPGVRVAISLDAKLKNVGKADVPWYKKFDTSPGNSYPPPYNRDQHPFLVWAMYMIVDDIPQQIGRSAVKHAFFSTNRNCSCGGGNILWSGDSSGDGEFEGCEDTYTVSNNDSTGALGIREEIPASSGLWEQCGSMFAPNATPPGPCTQTYFGGTNDDFERKLVVDEPKLSTPGATFYFEGWYVIRDDINIFNTMLHRFVTPSLGSMWTFNPSGDFQGPAIDSWVPPNTSTGAQAHVREATNDGHYSLAVKTTALGGGQHRYVYALMNYDFDPRFKSFSLEIPAGVNVTNLQFLDGDSDPANDWVSSTAGGTLAWTAPDGQAPLWGYMTTFVFEADSAPVEGTVELQSDSGGITLNPTILVLDPNPNLDFIQGFEEPGL